MQHTCSHTEVTCINDFETIRKYRCTHCGAVMMCACDEKWGQRFLPHQLDRGTELQTQRRVPVTLGFQAKICRECRGLPPLAAPLTAIPGRTTKIRRFYWREIGLRQFEILAEAGLSADAFFNPAYSDVLNDAEARAVADIKRMHEISPKYAMDTESEASFLKRLGVRVRDLRAQTRAGGEVLHDDGRVSGPEEFVMNILESDGYSAIQCESTPFHCLFAVFLWKQIQAKYDELQQTVSFGERSSFEAQRQSASLVHTVLPSDFGTSGYFERRGLEIGRFLKTLDGTDTKDLLREFDLATPGSEALRQYLWAHRERDLVRARRLIEMLPPEGIRRILRYLISNYWGNYLGWPDIIATKGSDVLFVEVKLSADKLSDEQRHWIEDNAVRMHFPFEIFKIHKTMSNSAKR